MQINQNYSIFTLLGSLIVLVLIVTSCRRDDYFKGDVDVTFSVDTLRFDTVFTTIGSMTRIVKVYNPERQPILVDIELNQTSPQFFRINANGKGGPIARNVEINGRDSIYIFVETTINPDEPVSISPFVIENFITVRANNREKKIHLEAFGQNANYITPQTGRGQAFLLSCNMSEIRWDDPKPYVIYGRLFIDSCKVVIPAGTRIHIYGGVVRDSNSVFNDGAIIVFKEGSIDARGTVDKPIIFEGDRLEPEFRNNSSQWLGLVFWQESKNNKLEHTIIKNSIFGIRADSLAQLELSSCEISNTGSAAILARYAQIKATNSLFYGNGSYGIQMSYGGQYSFDFCTIASYSARREGVYMDDVQCDDAPFCFERRFKPLNASFRNCIIAGTDKDEIALVNLGPPENFIYSLSHCIVKVEDLLKPDNFPNFFTNCDNCLNIKNNDRLFLDRQKNDYRLDTMSVALGKGLFLNDVQRDIIEKSRKNPPDPGCFEF